MHSVARRKAESRRDVFAWAGGPALYNAIQADTTAQGVQAVLSDGTQADVIVRIPLCVCVCVCVCVLACVRVCVLLILQMGAY
jgi:hypothetical protein